MIRRRWRSRASGTADAATGRGRPARASAQCWTISAAEERPVRRAADQLARHRAGCGARDACPAGRARWFRLGHTQPPVPDAASDEEVAMSLQGKTALVTGSTSGIGLGIARALAAAGADIVLNGFGEAAEIERLRAGIADSHGIRAHYAAADVTRPAEIREMVARAEREFGGCDILVNNAGVQFVAPIEEFPDEQWDRIVAINL